MYFVYLLYSVKKNKYYVGSCEDVNKRLIKHNTNYSGFTGRTLDWAIKYTAQFESKKDALKRERQIKGWKSRTMIEKLITGV